MKKKFFLVFFLLFFLSNFLFLTSKNRKCGCSHKREVIFYFNYYGCHLCNAKKARIIKKLKSMKADAQIIVKIVLNKDKRRLLKWFENFDAGVKPQFSKSFKKNIILINKNDKKTVIKGDLPERDLLREILKWLGKK